MKCTIVKEVRDKLRSIYEGNDKVKKSKLKTLSAQFESVKMKEEEDVATYFLRVDEIVNSITGLRATIKEKSVVQNIMTTLPTKFNSKVSILEDISYLDDLTKD